MGGAERELRAGSRARLCGCSKDAGPGGSSSPGAGAAALRALGDLGAAGVTPGALTAAGQRG